MITKEREKEKFNIQVEPKITEYDELEKTSESYNQKWKFIILSIITAFVILTLMVIYILNIYNMSIYNPYETKIINITSEQKDWFSNDNINIFNHINKNGEKVIMPGETGEYDFVIQNDNEIPVYYKIELSEENKDRVNMKYRVKLNNIYIIGNENTYETIDNIKLEDIKTLEKSKSLYTIEWKWEETDNDIEIAKNGLATYRIYIDIYSKSRGETLLKNEKN